MLSQERQAIILDELKKFKSITIQQLSETLNASESTVRRDLAELDAQGQLTKVHGGAVLKNATQISTKDATVGIRKEYNISEKEEIAKYAASLIQDDDFVYLDAGTTTDLMIAYITAKNAVFVTNAFSHAQKLAEAGLCTFILGGEIKLSTESVVGEEALQSLSNEGIFRHKRGQSCVRFFHARNPRGTHKAKCNAAHTGAVYSCRPVEVFKALKRNVRRVFRRKSYHDKGR